MDWKSKLDKAKDSASQDSQRKLEENWPKIEQLFREKVGPAALVAAKDDETMAKAIEIVYEALPFPIRMVVKQDVFTQFCLAHRDRLIGQASASGA